MSSRYRATFEEYEQDRKDFYASSPPKVGKDPSVDFDRVQRAWRSILETQDGPNYDDWAWGEGNSLERYIEFWWPPPADLLVVGAGAGREVHAARELGYQAEGITLGKENLPFAKWKFGLDLHYGDHCSMPYADESFDIIYVGQTFEHCHAPYVFLFECNRVLRQGGMLVMEWPPFIKALGVGSLEYSDEATDFMQDAKYDTLHHMCCWTPAQGRIITIRSNFEDVEVFVEDLRSESERESSCPSGYFRVTEQDPAYWSNISPGMLLLKAKKRPRERWCSYVQKIHGR